jgi:hypothetical protein
MKRVLLGLAAATASMLAQFGPVGPAATFLTLFPDARTVALGSAGVALDDLDANTYYNPANLTFGPRLAATWTHTNWLGHFFPGMSIDHAGVACRVGDRFGAAASVLYMQDGLQEVYTEHGEFIGSYRPHDIAAGVSAAYRILPSLSAGLAANVIYQFLYPAWAHPEPWPWQFQFPRNGEASTFACDAGIQYRPQDALTFGFAVANLGPNIRFDTTKSYFLPRTGRIGFAVRPPFPGPVSATVAGELSRDMFPAVEGRDLYHWGAGLELEFARLAFVRLGYLHYDRDGRRGFTWGVGIERRGVRLDVGVDSDVYRELGIRNVRFQFSARL